MILHARPTRKGQDLTVLKSFAEADMPTEIQTSLKINQNESESIMQPEEKSISSPTKHEHEPTIVTGFDEVAAV